jgi:hypothetical protein
LHLGRTIFITKGSEDPKDFRPIPMSLVITRHFHKILASRLSKMHSWDQRQRAFLPFDGCAKNLTVLNTFIHTARSKRRELHMASVDISKAFDSVPFGALVHEVVSDKGLKTKREINNFIYNKRTQKLHKLKFCGIVGVKQIILWFIWKIKNEKKCVTHPQEDFLFTRHHKASRLIIKNKYVLFSTSRVKLHQRFIWRQNLHTQSKMITGTSSQSNKTKIFSKNEWLP